MSSGGGAAGGAAAAAATATTTTTTTTTAATAAPGDDALLQQLLDHLDKHGDIGDSGEWARDANVSHNDVVGRLKRLKSNDYVALETIEHAGVQLTDEGRQYVESGESPERRLYLTVADKGLTRDELVAELGEHVVKVGWAQVMKRRWAKVDKKAGGVLVADASKRGEVDEDALVAALRAVASGTPDAKFESSKDLSVAALTKRLLVAKFNRKTYKVTKAAGFRATFVAPVVDLTAAMLASGAWKTATFKPLNLDALGQRPNGGVLHPLYKARSEFRQIFLEMGFSEMPTNRWVESGFWNFDSLFQPQQHPARDAHDTFHIAQPAQATRLGSDEYVERVRATHEHGGYADKATAPGGVANDGQSIGWRSQWSMAEAQQTILRTHTTAVSARMLHALAQQEGGFKPAKMFSIDRVFRNETTDQTHLAEFHQIEGWVADYNLSLGDLIGVLTQFFAKIGMPRLRFKPAYNPYTEPSMEVFAFHPLLKKWVEVGNSGLFRPEMLQPMGLPPDVRVIAWGLGLERPVMVKYGLSNIRQLVGHRLDIDFVRTNPIARLDRQ
mmetsp:Transcript_20796/g.50878  ORF Transcript_20796/g.50878 Transcript_20796/m.50878 type:complete len:556 (-) Transcript_20796:131-1798(-)